MNTTLIRVLTSRPARKAYKTAGKYTVKAVATIVCDVSAYFAAQNIIKGISKKTNFEPVNTCTINIKKVEA